MPKNYNHKAIEQKWQERWEREGTWRARDDATERRYVLDMFPYPSAQGLHVGHPEGYTASDIVSRQLRMKGVEVLHPMGWDAFGLPAENFAIKTGRHPREVTWENIDNFRRQIKSLGFSYDWSREVNTADPAYYRWTQWLFLELYKKGLAYKKAAPVNWCPSCQTVLANEQVIDGKCDRCKHEVEQKNLAQWFFKITDYADELLRDLDTLDWPERIKEMQRNWIGRSEGVNLKNKVKDLDIEFEVYDSIPQTFMAQTFTVIAPEHPLVKTMVEGTEHEKPVLEFVENIKQKKAANRFEVDKEIDGIFTGRYVENYAGTGRDLPIWVASFALMEYGTGMVNCSVHDERDFAFAKKYDIPLHPVMFPSDATEAEKVKNLEYCYTRADDGILQEPKEFVGRKWGEAREDIIEYIVEKGWGSRAVNYKLRDWLISRQRYWGAPIPIVYCDNCEEQKTKRVLLIHGFEGSGDGNWFPWMKQRLEKDGYEVFAPTMTTAANPDLEQWMAELTPYLNKLGPNDIVVGHSLGSKAALHLVAQGNKNIGGLVLVASAIGEQHERDWSALREKWPDADVDALQKFWETQVDFSAVNKHAAAVRLLLSHDDPYVQKKTHVGLPVEWSVDLWNGFGHFTKEEIPELLAYVTRALRTGTVPVADTALPVELPDDVDFRPTGESPLTSSKSFHDVSCPRCDGTARRESDTMDTFVDSSWYHLAYAMGEAFDSYPPSVEQIKNPDVQKKLQQWLPVDLYVGGAEHAVLHLLYARFITKVLRDLGYVTCSEPFTALRNQGMIAGEDGQKMSKSRGNVINPDDIVERFGADALRTYEMFMGPLEDGKPWSTNGLVGVRRFLERVWVVVTESRISNLELSTKPFDQKELKRKVAYTIKKVTSDIEGFRFNTAVSAMMELTNYLMTVPADVPGRDDAIRALLLCLYPFAPHLTAELWEQKISKDKPIWQESWPTFDEKDLATDTVVVVVQVNGKLRANLEVASDAKEEDIVVAAKTNENVAKWLVDKELIKTIYRDRKLVNFVVR